MRGLLALLLLVFAAPLAAQAPLLTSHLRIHDPWVVADTDSQTYWLFSRNDPAVTGDKRLGIMAYVSRDLAHWEKPRIVFTLPDGTWANEGAWAPEVHRWKGRWHLLATFHNEAAAIQARPSARPIGAPPCWRYPTGSTVPLPWCAAAIRSPRPMP